MSAPILRVNICIYDEDWGDRNDYVAIEMTLGLLADILHAAAWLEENDRYDVVRMDVWDDLKVVCIDEEMRSWLTSDHQVEISRYRFRFCGWISADLEFASDWVTFSMLDNSDSWDLRLYLYDQVDYDHSDEERAIDPFDPHLGRNAPRPSEETANA